MKLWQIGVFVYGFVYFMLACAMEADNVTQSYPMVYVGLSMVAQTLVVYGIFLFGLQAGAQYARAWRWLFPLLLLELLAGIVFDATLPPGPLDAEWGLNLLFSLWLATPAYYFNFGIARYNGR
jgi:hypothetical protein